MSYWFGALFFTCLAIAEANKPMEHGTFYSAVMTLIFAMLAAYYWNKIFPVRDDK